VSESTLSLTFANLYTDIGERLYATRTFSAAQKVVAQRLANDGLRRFLMMHEWGFLFPYTTIGVWPATTGTMAVDGDGDTTVTDATNSPFYASMIGHKIVADTSETEHTISGYTSSSIVTVSADARADDGGTFTITPDGNYTLPDDFGVVMGSFLYAPSAGYPKLNASTPQAIRDTRALAGGGAWPRYWAVEPVAFDSTVGQRWQLLLYPTPATARLLHYQYRVNPALMDTDAEYPPGGMLHGDTIRQFGYAMAELHQTHARGPEYDDALLMLQGSIALNATQYPPTVGMNNDPGMRRGGALDPMDRTSGVSIDDNA